jgi:hypothetical protein
MYILSYVITNLTIVFNNTDFILKNIIYFSLINIDINI